MNRPMFSPNRVGVMLVLVVITMWYLNVMARNTAPHGADRTRQEQPFTATTAVP